MGKDSRRLLVSCCVSRYLADQQKNTANGTQKSNSTGTGRDNAHNYFLGDYVHTGNYFCGINPQCALTPVLSEDNLETEVLFREAVAKICHCLVIFKMVLMVQELFGGSIYMQGHS